MPWIKEEQLMTYVKHMRTFGELAVIKTAQKIQAKMKNKGTTMMCVGYTNNHASDVGRFLNLETKRIVLSRDAIWLNKVKDKNEVSITTMDNEESEDESESENNNIDNTNVITDDETSNEENESYLHEIEDERSKVNEEEIVQPVKTPRVPRDLNVLQDEWNNEAKEAVRNFRRSANVQSPTTKMIEQGNKIWDNEYNGLFTEFAF